MTNQEAIKRIKEHIAIHKYRESHAIHIVEALEMAISALQVRSDIIHCGECKHRDPEDHKCDCGHDILWQLPREDEWFCADAKRKESDTNDQS